MAVADGADDRLDVLPPRGRNGHRGQAADEGAVRRDQDESGVSLCWYHRGAGAGNRELVGSECGIIEVDGRLRNALFWSDADSVSADRMNQLTASALVGPMTRVARVLPWGQGNRIWGLVVSCRVVFARRPGMFVRYVHAEPRR